MLSKIAIAVCPIAFGEVGVKERVKTLLNYKKPALWMIIVALLVCIVVAVCFLTNPKTNTNSLQLVEWLDKDEPQVVAEYPSNTDSKYIPEGEYVIFETYYEMSDGTWSTETLILSNSRTETYR